MTRIPRSSATPARPLRESVVEAVDALVRSRGWAATTMTDVAAAAGVSRQSVYNEFGTRRGLLEAYVGREVDALLTEVEVEMRARAGNAREAMRAAFALILRLASDEPLVAVIAADADADGAEPAHVLNALGRSAATERVGALIPQLWPQVSPADAAILAETLARLAISHALLPSADPETTAAAVTRIVGPFVDELLG